MLNVLKELGLLMCAGAKRLENNNENSRSRRTSMTTRNAMSSKRHAYK